MKYFVANWKANKTLPEAEQWVDKFLKYYQDKEEKLVIICPPFPLIPLLKQKLNRFKNLYLAAQDLSQFEEGSYTGEVTAKTIQGLVDFVLIGHSERRKYFNESNDSLSRKITLAKKYGIEPIFCLRNENDWLENLEIKIVAYEPTFAIGSGKNESPEKVLQQREKLALKPESVFLYGGSVDERNAKNYLQSDKIDGLLVGGNSLNPLTFLKIINAI